MGVLCYTKYKSNIKYKVIYNYVIPYLIILIITSYKFFKDVKKNKINSWPKCNLIILDKIIINIWNKEIINFKHKKK